MELKRTYEVPEVDIYKISRSLGLWFQEKGFEYQIVDAPGNAWVVQAKKAGILRTAFGMSAVLSVRITPEDKDMIVEIGSSQWADKAVGFTIGFLIAWPWFFTSLYGYKRQKDLQGEIFKKIETDIKGEIPIEAT